MRRSKWTRAVSHAPFDGLTWAERHLDLFLPWPSLPARELRAAGVTTAGALIAGGLLWALTA